MPKTLTINDFSAGWIPQDDPVGGRKNGLLKMDSVELDQTGALILTGGVTNVNSTNYPADAHTLYSKFLSGVPHSYLATTGGHVYRDTNSLAGTGGSVTRAAFGSAFDYVFMFSGTFRRKDDGTTTSVIGVTAPTAPTVSLNGAGILTGDYEYAQLNVFNHGNGYLAKSALGAISSSVSPSNEKVSVTPVSLGSDANEAWIFRRGNKLEQFYLLSVRNSGTGFGAFDDNNGDQYLLDFNVTINVFLAATNSTGLPDDVLEMVGPINGRMVFFTDSSIIFSEKNSPDNYDTRFAFPYASNQTTGSEIFLWARQVGENSIIIGTTQALYIVTGTFGEIADGVLDVYVRTLNTHYPPIGRDADVYNNSVVYMSNVGWILCNIDGSTVSLCPPSLDRLYKGVTYNGYGGVPIYIFPAADAGATVVRYACAVARNKLWVRVPTIVNNNPSQAFAYRMEVYDFVRKYWRPIQITPLLLWAQEDGAVMGFFSEAGPLRNLRYLDDPFSATFNGTAQTVNILTPFHDNNELRNRKDSLTLKFRIDTGGSSLTLKVYVNSALSGPTTISSSIASSGLNEFTFDLSSTVGVVKNWAFEISGQAAGFRFVDLTLDYEPHPVPVQVFKILRQSLGEHDGKKFRPRTWPFIIDTNGVNVTFTPTADGVALTSSTFNTSGKKHKLHFFKTDIYCNDLSGILQGNNDFEVWDILPPNIVQILPIAKQFDQIGPIELFRLGTLKKFETRLIAFGGTTIPYIIYLEDTSIETGNITVVDGKEQVYNFNIPRTDAGTMLRIELGPTSFNFHRIYSRILVAKSGKDTENEWVDLG